MTPVSPQAWADFYAAYVQKFRKLNDHQAQALCPFHEDRDPSLSIDLREGLFKCHGCQESGNAITFANKKGISKESLPGWETRAENALKIVATYDYKDESGKLLLQVVRCESKAFRQRRPDGKGGWIWDLNGTQRVLYRLPELLAAQKTEATAFIAEGEKDVDALRSHGFVATCNPMGAGKWRDEYADSFKGFLEAVIIADKDEPGRKHAQQVAASISKVVRRVKVLELAGAKVKDATDYFESGGTPKDLTDLVQAAPLWTPSNDSAQPKDPKPCGNIFNPVPAPQFVAQKQAERVWVWEKFIPQGGFVMLCGAPKAGKTTLAYHLAKAIGDGEPFLGFKTKPCPVLILALEEHPLDVQNRIVILGMSRSELIIHSGPLKSSVGALEAIKKEIQKNNIGLVIVDTLARFWMVKDENSASEVGPATEAVLNLARTTGAAVLLLHHLRKTPGEEGDDIRGSGDIFAIVDAAFTFRRRKDVKTQRILTSFSRYSSPEELIISLDDGRYTALGDSYHVKLDEQRSKILAVLSDVPKDSDEIAKLADIRPGTARTVLSELAEEGKAVKTGAGKKNDPFLYSLPGNHTSDSSAQNQTLRDAELFPTNGSKPESIIHPNVEKVQQLLGGQVRP